MKDKTFVQTERSGKQRSPMLPLHTAERESPVSPTTSTREAGPYISGRNRPTATALRALQRTVGNRAVQRQVFRVQRGLLDNLLGGGGGGLGGMLGGLAEQATGALGGLLGGGGGGGTGGMLGGLAERATGALGGLLGGGGGGISGMLGGLAERASGALGGGGGIGGMLGGLASRARDFLGGLF